MIKLFVTELAAVEIISLVAVTIAFVFSVVAAYQRLSKSSGFKRGGLILVNLIACLALIGLILQPQYQTQRELKITLHTNLTEDFAHDEKTFVLQSEQIGSPASDSLALKKTYQNRIIQTPEQLLLKFPMINELKIIGDGLMETQWRKFPNLKIDYQPPELPEGIIQSHWKSTLNLGETLVLTARMQSSSKKIFKAKLLDPAGDVVSETNLLAGELFELSAQPKLMGRHQYQLQVTDNLEQKISEETIPVFMDSAQAAKIIVLQSSPSFETKQLQNWAAENASQFLIRSLISKDIYQYRSTNIPLQQQKKNKALGLSEELFSQFDLLIVDGRELQMMTEIEKEAIRRSIDSGLGVLVLADQNLISLKGSELPELLSQFRLTALKQPTETIPYVVTDDLKSSPLAESFIPLSGQSIHFQDFSKSELVNGSSAFQPLVQTSQGHSLIAQVKRNSGQVAISLLQETHRLVTSGQKVPYSRLWHHLIKHIARKNQTSQYEVNSGNHLSFEKQLVEVCYFNSNTNPEMPNYLQVTGPDTSEVHQLLMQTDKLIQNRYCGYFWPKQMGWHTISDPNRLENPSKAFYISNNLAWSAYVQQKKINATKAKQSRFIKTDGNPQHYQMINQWIFWWIFIISASLIWTESKYFSQG